MTDRIENFQSPAEKHQNSTTAFEEVYQSRAEGNRGLGSACAGAHDADKPSAQLELSNPFVKPTAEDAIKHPKDGSAAPAEPNATHPAGAAAQPAEFPSKHPNQAIPAHLSTPHEHSHPQKPTPGLLGDAHNWDWDLNHAKKIPHFS